MSATARRAEIATATPQSEPPRDCPLCPRLVDFRARNRETWPDWYNGAVPTFGSVQARLLIVGLAPGLQGANRSGRPFTGDYAGDLLYASLLEHGLAQGRYERRADDTLELIDCAISNAVRCVPPQNKPLPLEINTCRPFLTATVAAMPRLRAVLALGKIAHDSVCKALGLKLSAHPFGHGAQHPLPGGRMLFDSYHCSRYNTNTRVLTEVMFHQVFRTITDHLAADT